MQGREQATELLLSVAVPHRGARLRFLCARPLGIALIMQFLASRHGQFTLHPAIFQVELCRDQREPLLANLAQQLIDFLPVQQKLTTPHRFVVLAVAMRVLANVSIHEPSFPTYDIGIALFELYLAGTGGLYLRAGEDDAGLIGFQQEVVMPGLAIVADQAVLAVWFAQIAFLSLLLPTISLNGRDPPYVCC